MKSSIKIDFIDRGTGAGIEPVIRIELIQTDDPRDKLISVLFESLHGQSYLQLSYPDNDVCSPNLKKTILLFKPEINTNAIAEIAGESFSNWIRENNWQLTTDEGSANIIYFKGDKTISSKELFEQFLLDKTRKIINPTPSEY